MMIIKILRSFSCCFAVLFKRSVPSPLLLFFWIESCFVSFTALIWMTKEQIVTGLSQDCHRTHTTSEQRILCKKTKRGRNPKRQQEDNSSSDSSQVKACKTLSPRMHSLLNLLLFLRKTSLVITRRWSVWRNENERERENENRERNMQREGGWHETLNGRLTRWSKAWRVSEGCEETSCIHSFGFFPVLSGHGVNEMNLLLPLLPVNGACLSSSSFILFYYFIMTSQANLRFSTTIEKS